jgi:hypothetical protein
VCRDSAATSCPSPRSREAIAQFSMTERSRDRGQGCLEETVRRARAFRDRSIFSHRSLEPAQEFKSLRLVLR